MYISHRILTKHPEHRLFHPLYSLCLPIMLPCPPHSIVASLSKFSTSTMSAISFVLSFNRCLIVGTHPPISDLADTFKRLRGPTHTSRPPYPVSHTPSFSSTAMTPLLSQLRMRSAQTAPLERRVLRCAPEKQPVGFLATRQGYRRKDVVVFAMARLSRTDEDEIQCC